MSPSTSAAVGAGGPPGPPLNLGNASFAHNYHYYYDQYYPSSLPALSRLLPTSLALASSLVSSVSAALAFDPALLRSHPVTCVLTHPPFVVLLMTIAFALHAARQHRRQRDRLAVLEGWLERALAAGAVGAVERKEACCRGEEGGGGGGGARAATGVVRLEQSVNSLAAALGPLSDCGAESRDEARRWERGEEEEMMVETEMYQDKLEEEGEDGADKRHLIGDAVVGMATRMTGLEKRVEDVMDAVDNVREGLLEVMKVLRRVVVDGDAPGDDGGAPQALSRDREAGELEFASRQHFHQCCEICL
jgi:hypothetical protein